MAINDVHAHLCIYNGLADQVEADLNLNRCGVSPAARAASIPSVAAWAVQAGAPLLEVCHLLRHSDIRMTMRYAHLAPEHVRAVVKRLENRDNSGVYDQATPGW